METYRWVTGLTIAVVFGGLVTQYYARRIKILVGGDIAEYRISIPISIGFVESLFFTIGVAFHLSGVMVAMVAWMGAKMAACWGDETQRGKVSNICTIRFLLLTGTLSSMLFSVIGGLVCAERI
jgi:hypothetical protein